LYWDEASLYYYIIIRIFAINFRATAISWLPVSVPALALGGVGRLPRASRFRGPHSSKKRALQAVDC